MRIETKPKPATGCIFYLKDALIRSVRKEAAFNGKVRTVLFEELGIDADVRLVPISLLPYGEDATVVLETEDLLSEAQAERIAPRIRRILQDEFMSGESFFVSVRALPHFGTAGIPIIDEATVKHFRRRPETKVVVAVLADDSTYFVLRLLQALRSQAASFKYVCAEYDDVSNELVQYVFSNRVSERIGQHLQNGRGVAIYE